MDWEGFVQMFLQLIYSINACLIIVSQGFGAYGTNDLKYRRKIVNCHRWPVVGLFSKTAHTQILMISGEEGKVENEFIFYIFPLISSTTDL